MFNIIVIAIPLFFTIITYISKSATAIKKQKILSKLFISCCIIAIPFIIWDIYVTNLHWYFNTKYITGIHFLTLPVEELLFFFSVPYATGTLWLVLFHPHFFTHGTIDTTKTMYSFRWIYLFCIPLLASSIYLLSLGYGYTGYTCIALACAIFFDFAIGSRVLQQRRFYNFIVLYTSLNFIFNGYLTWRPIVLYHKGHYLAFRIGTIPIEDFLYGLALFIMLIAFLQHNCKVKCAESLIQKLIRYKLKNYKIQFNTIHTTLPTHISKKYSVAVIGGGFAGISSAILLAQRGYSVQLFETNKYLGGKCASWKKKTKKYGTVTIDHGFHGFFNCYYNSIDFLQEHNILHTHTKAMETYTMVNKQHKVFHLDNTKTVTPPYNMFHLSQKKIFNLYTSLLTPANWKLLSTLQYEVDKITKKYDTMPFSEFIIQAKLNSNLAHILAIFARAFFATNEKVSTAQLLKNFHFYYFSNDKSLQYHYITPNYTEGFLLPLEKIMQNLGIQIHTNTSINTINASQNKNNTNNFTLTSSNITTNTTASHFDAVIIASDIQSTKNIIFNSPIFENLDITQQLMHIPVNQKYSVYRIWIQCKLPFENYSIFTSVERPTILDTITQIDAIDDESNAWSKKHNGHILELHSYAIPDDMNDENSIKTAFLEDLKYYFPQFTAQSVVYEDFQSYNNFTPFTIGIDKYKPSTHSSVDGCYFAGDWVKLPIPCSLLENAHTSARFAVNEVLKTHNLQEIPIYSVPLKGLFRA